MWEEKIASFRKKLINDASERSSVICLGAEQIILIISRFLRLCCSKHVLDTVVIPYYERFLDWFPTVADLAQAFQRREASSKQEGLGFYYSQVQKCESSQQIMTDFDGKFPDSYEGGC